MELRADLLGECLVRGIADEQVPEAIHVIGLVWTDDLVAHERP